MRSWKTQELGVVPPLQAVPSDKSHKLPRALVSSVEDCICPTNFRELLGGLEEIVKVLGK